jgi:hypothetical protein
MSFTAQKQRPLRKTPVTLPDDTREQRKRELHAIEKAIDLAQSVQDEMSRKLARLRYVQHKYLEELYGCSLPRR